MALENYILWFTTGMFANEGNISIIHEYHLSVDFNGFGVGRYHYLKCNFTCRIRLKVVVDIISRSSVIT